MEKKFVPEKYGMMICPVCDGGGRICSPDDVKVCQNCGGFGFIKGMEGKFRSRHIEMRPYPNPKTLA